MKKERILSFQMSEKLSAIDVESVSAAGMTSYVSGQGSYKNGYWDASIDWTVDV